MTYRIEYSTRFVRAFKKLPPPLQEEVVEKVMLLSHEKNHERLHLHKLNGKLKDLWAFSVNYRVRVTCAKIKNTFVLSAIGTHDEVY